MEGYRENVADFYQHQYLGTDPAWEMYTDPNGVMKIGGWCRETAIANSLYSFVAQGFTGLLPDKVMDKNDWQQAICDGIKEINAAMLNPAKGIQGYLADKGYGADSLVGFKFTQYVVIGSGETGYKSSDGSIKLAGDFFDVYQRELLAGQDVMVVLGRGTNTDADRWWSNYHYVTGVGFDAKNKKIYFADPDSNKGNTRNDAGWDFTKTDPDVNARKYDPNDMDPPVPGPRANPTDDPPDKDKYYGTFMLGAGNKVSNDAVNERYKGVSIDTIETISPVISEKFFERLQEAGKWLTDFLVAAVPNQTVESIHLFPTSQVEPSLFSDTLIIDSGGLWDPTYLLPGSLDPWGNSRPYGGVSFNLVSGDGLHFGESPLTATIGTVSPFLGFDVMVGLDDGTTYLTQAYGPIEDFLGPQLAVPEPLGMTLLLAGLAMAAARRRRFAFAA
jgi:hypothetical protein